MKEKQSRTPRQNNALHKYCTLLAEALNDAGLDAKKTLKPEIEIPWTGAMVKDLLWRPVQEAMTGKISTTELTTTEPNDVYSVLDRHLVDKFGIHVEFPKEDK